MLLSEQYAQWHQFFENISVSAQESYTKLEQALMDHKVPGITVSRIEFPEGGIMSPNRLYLVVKRDTLVYHICVAQFGTGFFVSSRLLDCARQNWEIIIAGIGISLVILYMLGFGILALFFILLCSIGALFWWHSSQRLTYYRLDTMAAFQEVMHRIVVTHVNQVVEATGRKPLSDEERKPVLHKLLARH